MYGNADLLSASLAPTLRVRVRVRVRVREGDVCGGLLGWCVCCVFVTACVLQ